MNRLYMFAAYLVAVFILLGCASTPPAPGVAWSSHLKAIELAGKADYQGAIKEYQAQIDTLCDTDPWSYDILKKPDRKAGVLHCKADAHLSMSTEYFLLKVPDKAKEHRREALNLLWETRGKNDYDDTLTIAELQESLGESPLESLRAAYYKEPFDQGPGMMSHYTKYLDTLEKQVPRPDSEIGKIKLFQKKVMDKYQKSKYDPAEFTASVSLGKMPQLGSFDSAPGSICGDALAVTSSSKGQECMAREYYKNTDIAKQAFAETKALGLEGYDSFFQKEISENLSLAQTWGKLANLKSSPPSPASAPKSKSMFDAAGDAIMGAYVGAAVAKASGNAGLGADVANKMMGVESDSATGQAVASLMDDTVKKENSKLQLQQAQATNARAVLLPSSTGLTQSTQQGHPVQQDTTEKVWPVPTKQWCLANPNSGNPNCAVWLQQAQQTQATHQYKTANECLYTVNKDNHNYLANRCNFKIEVSWTDQGDCAPSGNAANGGAECSWSIGPNSWTSAGGVKGNVQAMVCESPGIPTGTFSRFSCK